MIDGRLSEIELKWTAKPSVCVVMASGGYPGKYEKGKAIDGLMKAGALPDTIVFHAGTKASDGEIVTSGGRVLGVTALGKDLESAISGAYRAVDMISFDGAHYRKDIGAKALKRIGK